jgi:hypothetical protein
MRGGEIQHDFTGDEAWAQVTCVVRRDLGPLLSPQAELG